MTGPQQLASADGCISLVSLRIPRMHGSCHGQALARSTAG